ncbi:MAG: DNA internalization-related competence protein ComEC/Rec2 [Lachnospiraceae bacterium]
MKNRPLCSICLIVSVFLCISICLGGQYFLKELKPSQAEMYLQQKDELWLTGRVYQKEEKDKYQILYLKDNSITCHQQSLKESKIIVYDENKLKVDIGDVLAIKGEISFFENARNPGNFDQKRYYQRQNIHASIWAQSVSFEKNNLRTWCECGKEMLSEFQNAWKEKIFSVMREKDAKTVSAMLLGEKAEMDQELKELYQVNGIGHILAISGLHLSFVGLGIYRIFRRISGSYTMGGVLGIAFLSLYVLMVGVTVSVFRAFLMFLFRVGADITGRNYDGITALSFAALAVLLWRPLSPYDSGFWLSFGAVSAIYLVHPVFRNLPFQGMWASVSIQLITLPVILYSYYEFPTYSVFLNIIVVPVMSLILACILTGSLIGLVPLHMETVFFKIAGMFLKIYEWLCNWTLNIPGARIVTGKPEKWQVAAYYICLFAALFLYSQLRKKRKCILIVLFGIGLGLLAFPFGKNGKLMVTVIDVGQGDGIFIRGPEGGNYLIDGGSSDVKNVGKYRIEPFLKSKGVRKLDYVFVSHGDDDHINGIEEMLEREKVGIEIETLVFPPQNVWDEKLTELAKKARDYCVEITVAEPGESLKEGDMFLTCLGPEKEFEGESGNASSMILTLSYYSFDMLFTGDVEGKGEENLMKVLKERGETFEVLKAAHHGSKNSSTEEFLKISKPVVTIISAGRGNRYGHPHQETLDRLKAIKSSVYSTQKCGAITIEVGRNNFMLDTYCD